MADPEFYRNKQDVAPWRDLDPIKTFRKKLTEDKVLEDRQAQAIETEVEQIVNDATTFAEESADPPAEALYRDVYRSETHRA